MSLYDFLPAAFADPLLEPGLGLPDPQYLILGC
jgi:hypothetical protein